MLSIKLMQSNFLVSKKFVFVEKLVIDDFDSAIDIEYSLTSIPTLFLKPSFSKLNKNVPMPHP